MTGHLPWLIQHFGGHARIQDAISTAGPHMAFFESRQAYGGLVCATDAAGPAKRHACWLLHRGADKSVGALVRSNIEIEFDELLIVSLVKVLHGQVI